MKKRILALALLALLLLPHIPARAALYDLGDTMADFALTTIDGEEITLAGLLAERRAVLLNFWFIDCPWCDYEFPFLQEAWEEWESEVAVVAVTPYDSAADAREYRDSKGLTFPVAEDSAGLSAAFGVTGFPTSVVIDRYGVVVFSEAGAQSSTDAFRAIFSIYAAEKYEQSLVGFNVFAPRPSETMPPVEDVAAALNELGTPISYATLTEDEWPWLIITDSGREYAVASNTFVDESTAWLRASVSARAGDVLAFDYRVSSEYMDDYFAFYVNGKATKVFSGETDWTSFAYRFAEDGEYSIAFAFEKGFSGREGDDIACVDSLRLLSGAQAAQALAANPVWPASLEGEVCAIEAAGTLAREVVISDPSGRLYEDYRMDSFYIVPEGEAEMRLLLGDGCDPDAVLLFDAAAQEIFHPSACETDETGFLFSADLLDLDDVGHRYGAVRAYPFYGDYETGVNSAMMFDSEETLELFLQLAIVDGEGQPLPDVTWAYVDDAVFTEKDYSLYFSDESGAPTPGVAVRVCYGGEEMEFLTDENGAIHFTATPRAYAVEVLKVPSGLYFDASAGLQFPEEGGEIGVKLTFAE